LGARGDLAPPATSRMVIVRLLLFFALAAIGVALLLWFVKRDPRYLRFIGLTLKFTLVMLLAVLLGFAAERLLAPTLGPLL
jgi:energy-converting hydrogenase Eha subunit E